MARVESSAVNKLIDLVAMRPLDRDSQDDLLFARPPGAEPANASNRPKRKSAVRIMPASATVRPIPNLRLVPAANAPRAPSRNAVDQARAVTFRSRVQQTKAAVFAKIAGVTLLLVLAGIAIGNFAFSAGDPPATATPSKVEPAQVATPAMPAPSIATAVTPSVTEPPVATPTPPPTRPAALVDVRVESTPPGATVTLVDNGKSSFVGTTPVDASVDPTRSYEIVLSRDGEPSHTEHLDPKATQRLTVVLEASAPTKAAVTAPVKQPHRKTKASLAKKSTKKAPKKLVKRTATKKTA